MVGGRVTDLNWRSLTPFEDQDKPAGADSLDGTCQGQGVFLGVVGALATARHAGISQLLATVSTDNQRRQPFAKQAPALPGVELASFVQ